MAEWFRHDLDARNDIKLKKLIRDCGLAGLGAFWAAVEIIYKAGGSVRAEEIMEELDFMGAEDDFVRILAQYGLIKCENGIVTSDRVEKEIQYQEECKQRLSNAGRTAANARWHKDDANVCDRMRPHTAECDSMRSDAIDATIPDLTNKKDISDTKVSSISKEKTAARFQKPTVEEIREYCSERNNSVDPQSFFDFYESKGWMVGSNHMKDWKAAVRTWERSERSNPVSGRKKMTTDQETRMRLVNPDGSLNLLGARR